MALQAARQLFSRFFHSPETAQPQLQREIPSPENQQIIELQNGPFTQATQYIKQLFQAFQEEVSLEGQKVCLEKIHHEITFLRNTILLERKALLAANQHVSKKELTCLERETLVRTKSMEDTVEATMRQATAIIDIGVKTQFSLPSQEAHVDFLGFCQESNKILEITSPQNQFEREWELAKNLYKKGFATAAITIIKKLPLPTYEQSIFDKLLETPEAVRSVKLGLFFQIAEQTATSLHFQCFSKKIKPKTQLSDLLVHQTILDVFSRYISPVILMRVNSSFHEIVSRELSLEYIDTRAKKVPHFSSFSLEFTPKMCKTCFSTALVALFQNALEYQHLDPLLQNDIGIVKIALVSILQKQRRTEYELLVSLFPENIQAKLPECLRDIKADSGQALLNLKMQEKDKLSSYVAFLARAFVKKFPNDKDICRIMVQISGDLLQFVSRELQDDTEVVLLSLYDRGTSFKFASERLKNDPYTLLKAIKQGGEAFTFASKELQNDEKIAIAAVTENRFVFWAASKRLQDTEAVVLAAVTKEGNALEDASERLQDDERIVRTAVTQNGKALEYASERLQNFDDIVLIAVKQYGRALAYASTRLKDTEQIVLAAVTSNWGALQLASKRLQNNETIVIAALKQSWFAIENASDTLKDNEQFILFAISQSWRTLGYASTRLKDKKHIVLAALAQEGRALQFASKRLKDTKEIVEAAMKKDPKALEFASDRLQKLLQ